MAEELAREVIVEPGGGGRIAGARRHQDAVDRAHLRQENVEDVE